MAGGGESWPETLTEQYASACLQREQHGLRPGTRYPSLAPRAQPTPSQYNDPRQEQQALSDAHNRDDNPLSNGLGAGAPPNVRCLKEWHYGVLRVSGFGFRGLGFRV
jgi:hypothetical protein